ncbi:ligase-associated DNA damage response endonuclease PdeM [Phreatobacter stygius]|uniref:Ligase-associated DNA damage response endonuclease PdeM n=1 Tax=Phreatobacter stygius TaxID=1940610 RepID=A0A4D7BA30_9HYPH|nr:ligase-associated DNA damage response endonuclease PdeM [Phreatobacter stygius]QCI64937.1 ligase-associated DNA damage response endonuclease PdeM [Phreatobacter stygius]
MTAAPARKLAETIIPVADQAFVVDCSGALWWDDRQTLVVSDLHLEKGSSFAARGVLLPPYDTAATLAMLALALDRFRPRRVIALGDSFHDGGALDRIADSDRTALGDLQRGLSWIWIEGNHDEALSGILPGEHATTIDEQGLVFVHQPSSRPARGEIAGHFHPCAKVRGRGRGIRRRAFASDGQRLVMPAFGAYTGGLNVRSGAIEALFPRGFSAFMLGDERIYTFPQAHCLPD